MANKRVLPDWLKGLAEYVEDSEAPRLYFLWSGIITLAATLQRRVWIPYGLEEIFPNLYVMLVANPGERKAAPISIAKKLLESAEIPVAVDSTSKRALTKELAEIYKGQYLSLGGTSKRNGFCSYNVKGTFIVISY